MVFFFNLFIMYLLFFCVYMKKVFLKIIFNEFNNENRLNLLIKGLKVCNVLR